MGFGGVPSGFDSVIEGAAALFVIFWLVASGCSFVAEAISAVANTRGNALQQFTIEMVQGELKRYGPSSERRAEHHVYANWFSKRINLSGPAISGFSASLFSHNLFKSLEQPKLWRNAANTAPAYVPSNIFAQAIVDRLLNFSSVRHFIEAGISVGDRVVDQEKFQELLAIAADDIEAYLVRIDRSGHDNAYLMVVAALDKYLATDCGQKTIRKLNEFSLNNSPVIQQTTSIKQANAIADIWFGGPNGDLAKIPASLAPTVSSVILALKREDVPAALKQALQPLIDASKHDIDALRNNIAVWYDASMARASGWYKRSSMVVLFVLGLVAAMLLNIDSPRIITALINDPVLRRAGYSAAVQVVEKRSESDRQAMAQQISFARAVDTLCEAPAAAEEMAGNACKEVEAAKIKRLLPLTLTSGSSGRILIDLQLFKLQSSKEQFFQSVKEFCATDSACSEPLNEMLKSHADAKAAAAAKAAASLQTEIDTAKVAKDEPNDPAAATAAYAAKSEANKDAEAAKVAAQAPAPAKVHAAIWNDTRIFWSAALAACLYRKTSPKGVPAADCRKDAVNARNAAMGATGALSNYAQGIPGVGPIWYVYTKENWRAGTLGSALFGWILTALMVSLGAPFWFDLLQQIVNRRGAGPKPAEATPSPVQ